MPKRYTSTTPRTSPLRPEPRSQLPPYLPSGDVAGESKVIPAAFRRIPEQRPLRQPRPGMPPYQGPDRNRTPARNRSAMGGPGSADAATAVARAATEVMVRDDPSRLTVWTQSCDGLEEMSPRQTLVVSYSFEAAASGDPYAMEVQLSGQQAGPPSSEGTGSFSVTGRVHRVIPGSGMVTLTVRIPDLAPGQWQVVATPIKPAEESTTGYGPVRTTGATSVAQLAPLVGPGLRIGGWPAMVAAGALVGMVVQAALAHRVGLPVAELLWVTLVACVLGVFGAKLYYARTHPEEQRGILTVGMSLQGFVLVTFTAIVALAVVLSLPLGTVLDASAPALLIGQAVGRIGCRFGGCCLGRPTASRWGIWGADRMVGVRRVPVRLMESLAALILAVGTAATVILGPSRPAGWLFVAGISAYIFARQLLLPLRELPRATKHGRAVTLGVAAAALATALVVLTVA